MTPPARARLGTWPYEPDVAHLVLLDHHMVPTTADVRRWIAEARSTGARLVRTGALFPPSTGPFVDAGFRPIDRLALLALPLDRATSAHGRTPDGVRLGRLRSAMLDQAAAIDRRAFDAPWADDAPSLGDIVDATPQHRARMATQHGEPVGFAITGRAGRTGYIQRLAVDPVAHRRGVGSALLGDAIRWLARRRVEEVLVNTATTNDAALALYRRHGFVERPAALVIAELPLS